jgi:hypothetical protein
MRDDNISVVSKNKRSGLLIGITVSRQAVTNAHKTIHGFRRLNRYEIFMALVCVLNINNHSGPSVDMSKSKCFL